MSMPSAEIVMRRGFRAFECRGFKSLYMRCVVFTPRSPECSWPRGFLQAIPVQANITNSTQLRLLLLAGPVSLADGAPFGALAGAFFIGIINNGLNLFQVSTYDQLVVK